MHKFKEALLATLPISIIILILAIFVLPGQTRLLINLGIGFVLLVFGVTLFSAGADDSMSEVGRSMGSNISASRHMWFIVLSAFVIGFIITFAEPDLEVFARQVAESGIGISSKWVMMIAISLGVSAFLALALMKIVFKWNIAFIVGISYIAVIILSMFLPDGYASIALDSGGVTTGAVSVPFLIAFGLGFSNVRGGDKGDDRFGLIAMCSAGPILVVMIMGMFVKVGDTSSMTQMEDVVSAGELFASYFKDVAIVILPIVLMFLIYNTFLMKMPFRSLRKIFFGFIYTYVGISLFLVGVSLGFMPLGIKLGEKIASSSYSWILYPLGLILGYFSVAAEPSLQVLKKQVEEITGGMISQKTVAGGICLGTAFALLIGIVRVMFNINILYIIIPVYALTLILMLLNSQLFVGISFDSGGVAMGTMAVSFILPLLNGVASGLGQAGSGFGTMALIAIFPVMVLETIGLIHKIKVNSINKRKEKEMYNSTIVDFDWE